MNKRYLVAAGIGLALGAGLFAFILLNAQCVVEGSLVETPSGPRPIESLRPGDLVSVGAREGRILRVFPGWSLRHLALRIGGRDLRVTSAHRIATPSGWREAGTLAAGDVVLTGGGRARIESIETRWSLSRVFDLEVEPESCFLADGVLVHNKTAVRSSNERNAAATLKTLTTAEADFRSNDRDGNEDMDFWVADVRGLFSIVSKRGGAEIKLIEPAMANADGAPRIGAGDTRYGSPPPARPEPKAGYLFRALTHYADADGKKTPYDTGNGRNRHKYGFIAVPVDSSAFTFIISEGVTIWRKKLEGAVIDTYPANPLADGWTKLD